MAGVERTVTILEALGRHREPLNLSAVAKRAGLDKSTTLRYLLALELRGFVSRDEHGTYTLGIRVFELGQAVVQARDIRQLALPAMREIAVASGETVNLGLFDRDSVVIIEAVESTQPIRHGTTVGERDGLYYSALGKAVLSQFPPSQRESICERLNLQTRTPRTLTRVDALIADLTLAAHRGYAVDDQEGFDGVRCIGVAIRDRTGFPAYALSVTGPSGRLTRRRATALAPRLIDAARHLSEALGYTSGDFRVDSYAGQVAADQTFLPSNVPTR